MSCIVNTEGNAIVIAIAVAVVLLFFGAVSFYINVFIPFIEKRKYIKMELENAEDEEYEYWKNELKELYLSYIPFAQWFRK